MGVLAANARTIAEAGRRLRAGALVAFPTETVYGLGADATNALAVARIFEAKGRPRFNPLIVHVAEAGEVPAIARLTPLAERLAQAFWPGPLTLVLEKAAGCAVADLATAGLDTVAVRVPGHDVARAVLQAAGVPVAAPSANRSGRVSPTCAAHVAEDFGEADMLVLDGGPTGYGLESTIVDATGKVPVLLRTGAVTRAQIARMAGAPVEDREAGEDRPSAPGQLASHYAPRARVRLGATSVAAGEALLAFGPHIPAHAGPVRNLSPAGDLREAAANLFAHLRALDAELAASGGGTIAVTPIPAHGLGEAINDRLRRAAAPR